MLRIHTCLWLVPSWVPLCRRDYSSGSTCSIIMVCSSRLASLVAAPSYTFFVCMLISHLRPMSLNVLGYQFHLHTAIILPSYLVTKNLPISLRFSPTIFYRNVSSVLLHLVNQWLDFILTHDSALVIYEVSPYRTFAINQLVKFCYADFCLESWWLWCDKYRVFTLQKSLDVKYRIRTSSTYM